MKIARFAAVAVATTALALCACGKKEGGEGEGSGGGGGGGGGGAATVDLAKLGLKADVPKGAKVGDAIMGEGHMIQGPGITVTIEEGETPKTVEDAKKDATGTYDGVTNVKEEKLADGYILTFENKGGMGTNYWLVGRREIDGKAYKCSVTAPQAAHQKSGAAICKSLKK